MLNGVLYVSVAAPTLDEMSIQEILVNARQRNFENEITGQLHYENRMFIQWLEGPRAAVGTLWNSITRDHRHSEIIKMFSGNIAKRLFENWDMRFTTARDGVLLDFMKERRVDLKSGHVTDANKLLLFLTQIVQSDHYASVDKIADPEKTNDVTCFFVSKRTRPNLGRIS